MYSTPPAFLYPSTIIFYLVAVVLPRVPAHGQASFVEQKLLEVEAHSSAAISVAERVHEVGVQRVSCFTKQIHLHQEARQTYVTTNFVFCFFLKNSPDEASMGKK